MVEIVNWMVVCGILIGGYVIFGFLGEIYDEIIVQVVELFCLLLIIFKMYQLQLICGMKMVCEFECCFEDFYFFSVDEYIDLVIDYVEYLCFDLIFE